MHLKGSQETTSIDLQRDIICVYLHTLDYVAG